MVYAPGTLETDQKKQNMALQQQASAITTNTTDIATNTANIATNTANITALMPGYLFGLTLSTAGSSATFSVAAGSAADSAGTAIIALASAISKTTSSWAVGTGNGALDTGSIANSTWYHVFLIKRTDTDVEDVLISTSASSPTMPTSYTLKRRIGAMRTNGSAQWVKFVQVGDDFLWDVRVSNKNAEATATSSALATVTVPTGVQVVSKLTARIDAPAGSSISFLLTSPDESDQALSTTAQSLIAAAAQISGATFDVRTNTSAQVRYISSITGGSFYLNTYGWIDRRGRDV